MPKKHRSFRCRRAALESKVENRDAVVVVVEDTSGANGRAFCRKNRVVKTTDERTPLTFYDFREIR